MKEVVHAACPHDCPDACGVLITVQDGRATKIQGDPSHPVTRGFLCAKVAKYLDRVYSPDRVLYPMRRVRPKGPVAGEGARATQAGQAFERIGWDEALDEICSRLRGVASEFGSEAILPYSYGGTLGALNGASMDRRFFHRLGASQLARNICSAAGEAGLKSVLGVKLGTEPEQFRHSRYIIAWASNIHGNNVHLWPFIAEARRNGAKLVVIDPYRTRTAACADWYLPINPGTDAALALAMMHVIIGENLYAADYVAQYTLGFDELREKVKDYPPERVAQWTGIGAEDTRRLAREYATLRPSVIRVNYGVQRSEGGGMAINTLNDPPVEALFVYNSNPAAVCPNHNDVIRGLRRPDLFTVVHEQFFTDTTDYADIVLPATTFFEHKELQTAYGHYYLQMSHQAIEPPGECRSNVELFRALAEHMGFEDECFKDSVDQMMDGALASENPWLRAINRDRLEREGHVRLSFEEPRGDQGSKKFSFFLPFAKGNFATPS